MRQHKHARYTQKATTATNTYITLLQICQNCSKALFNISSVEHKLVLGTSEPSWPAGHTGMHHTPPSESTFGKGFKNRRRHSGQSIFVPTDQLQFAATELQQAVQQEDDVDTKYEDSDRECMSDESNEGDVGDLNVAERQGVWGAFDLVCMYVCMYVCMCVYVLLSIYVCMICMIYMYVQSV